MLPRSSWLLKRHNGIEGFWNARLEDLGPRVLALVQPTRSSEYFSQKKSQPRRTWGWVDWWHELLKNGMRQQERSINRVIDYPWWTKSQWKICFIWRDIWNCCKSTYCQSSISFINFLTLVCYCSHSLLWQLGHDDTKNLSIDGSWLGGVVQSS